ncbi:FliM/FliN family flagellar motor switch protein [Oricola thermophila]|uniref:Flagellar motor switch protein FliN n=1 Tax=Oricola thermophila TaxID=2742145 RepID=A0A6N1VFM6_9HYPH|nr:FliM/FliN family flagellar motor switch protein [Oricola thermophila]QKV19654.1 FliM/FliN family flagellar motor switch protein [Oricola thermophila]
MSEPEPSPLDDLPPLSEQTPDLSDPPGTPDALDEAIAELQGVIEKDSEMGPLDDEFAGANGDRQAPGTPSGGLQGMVMSIPVQVDVIIGSAEMPVAELMSMEAGSVVSLNRKIGEAVDICVNGTKIATGEIQSLEDDPSRLGVKILSLEQS